MENFIIIIIIAILVLVGVNSMLKHFKGQGGCCGGGNTYVSKKKLKDTSMILKGQLER